MKILFFHRWVGVHKGGTETHIRELADRFQKLGHQVTILTRQGKELSDFNPAVRIIRVSRNIGESDHSYEDFRVYIHTMLFIIKSFFKLLLMAFKGDHFDVVSVHFFTEAIIAKAYTFFRKTSIVFILEGYTPLEAKAAKFAKRRISISLFEANVYKSKHSLDSVVIPIGVDRGKFSVSKEDSKSLRGKFVSGNEKLALTVCRLEPRKDLLTLVKAVKSVQNRLEQVKFVLVGDGISREKIEAEIIAQGLSGKIFLAGRVSDSELPFYYAAADFFVLPTKEEWFGIVFVEAMSSGLPIITTNVDACPEVVKDCGIYFKPGDYTVLAEKIIELSGNDVLIKELSGKAILRSKEFDWDNIIKKYEEQYTFA